MLNILFNLTVAMLMLLGLLFFLQVAYIIISMALASSRHEFEKTTGITRKSQILMYFVPGYAVYKTVVRPILRLWKEY